MVVGVYTAIVVVCAHAQDLSCLPLGFYIDIVWRNKLITVEPHLSEPQVSGCSDYPALMVEYSN